MNLCYDLSKLRLAHTPRLLTVLCCALLTGCTGLALGLANVPARFGDYEVVRDLAYGSGKARRLDVYRPAAQPTTQSATKKRKHPLVVFFYGGRWSTGNRRQYRFVAEALTTRGYVVVVPDYRHYPETRFPGFIEDAADAVAWSHQHAPEFDADPERLFVMGHSAGAHIAAMLSFDERFVRAAGGEPSWIRGFIGLAGPYDFLPITDPVLQKIFAPEDRYPLSQPINFVDGAEPPALLLHGREDRTVWPRNSVHLAARIRSQGGRVTEQYFDDMNHSDILAAFSHYYRKRRTVLEEIDRFVEEASN